jgi:hypothetical protein
MAMKATGAEIWAFYQEWPPGEDWYHDDYATPITDDETSETCVLDLTKKYEVSDFGNMVWQGSGEVPRDIAEAARRYGDLKGMATWIPFEWWFRRWKKTKTSSILIVDCPSDKLEELSTFLKRHGIKATRS